MATRDKHRTPTLAGMVSAGTGTGMTKYTRGLPMSLPTQLMLLTYIHTSSNGHLTIRNVFAWTWLVLLTYIH